MKTLSSHAMAYTGDYKDHDPRVSRRWPKSKEPRHDQGLRGGWGGAQQSHHKDVESDPKTI